MASPKINRFLETAFLGFLALMPIGVAGYVLVKLYGLMKILLGPVGDFFGVERFLSGLVVLVILIFSVFVALYLFGLLFRTSLGEAVGDFFDRMAKNVVPGYEAVTTALNNHLNEKMAYPAAFVRTGPTATRSFGFIMEDHGNGDLTVFIPSAPIITVGTIYIVDQSQVERIDAPTREAVDVVAKWGLGTSKLKTLKSPEQASSVDGKKDTDTA